MYFGVLQVIHQLINSSQQTINHTIKQMLLLSCHVVAGVVVAIFLGPAVAVVVAVVASALCDRRR